MPNFAQAMKAVYVTAATKRLLKDLCRNFPDIKMWTFVDEAIKNHITLELRKREIMENQDERPDSKSGDDPTRGTQFFDGFISGEVGTVGKGS